MPIRLRLALWYGGLTGLVVVFVSLLTYALHSRVHYDQLDQLLIDTTEHVAEEYLAAPTSEERSAVFTVPVAPNLVVRLYDTAGQVRLAGPNAGAAPLVDPRSLRAQSSTPVYDPVVGLAPRLLAVHTVRGTFWVTRAGDESRWRIYVLDLDAAEPYLVVAAPLAQLDASVEAFRRLIPILAAAGFFIAFIGARLLAGRALKPVTSLTETAMAIARSRSFKERVPTVGPRDELGHLGAAFNEMLNSLEQSYQAQQRFVSDASHELRAPLTAIQANLELLKRQPDMPAPERYEAVEEACRESQRLVHLVADLLALARADAGVAIRRQRVEVDRVLLDALSEARHLASGQQLELGALEPAIVEGDPDRLKQLLLILLDNALKYTERSQRVCLDLRREGSMVTIAVRDSGEGIPPEDLPRVFERFYRADPARARDPGGTGLGLPIARWIAEQHGGDIMLDSELGRGTTATVRLPIAS